MSQVESLNILAVISAIFANIENLNRMSPEPGILRHLRQRGPIIVKCTRGSERLNQVNAIRIITARQLNDSFARRGIRQANIKYSLEHAAVKRKLGPCTGNRPESNL